MTGQLLTVYYSINGVNGEQMSSTAKQNLLMAQPLTVYDSINGVNSEKHFVNGLLKQKTTFKNIKTRNFFHAILMKFFFQKRLIRFVNDLKINGFY